MKLNVKRDQVKTAKYETKEGKRFCFKKELSEGMTPPRF